jgi:hypothetical protein
MPFHLELGHIKLQHPAQFVTGELSACCTLEADWCRLPLLTVAGFEHISNFQHIRPTP